MTTTNTFDYSNLLSRAWKKLARIRVLSKPMTVAEDIWAAGNFWVSTAEREMQYAAFENCKDLENYFGFTESIFGSHQIKQEIITFLEFAQTEQPQNVCEIGTANGGTNFLLSQTLPDVSLMIGIDLYVKNSVQLNYFKRKSQQMIFINGSSYAPRTLDKVKQILSDRMLDLLFIDGDHTYEGVKQDFLCYRHLVRDGGIIAFHDIIPDYNTRYGIQTGRWVGGVPQFWSQIKSLYPFVEFIENPEQDGLGIGVIRYSAKTIVPENL